MVSFGRCLSRDWFHLKGVGPMGRPLVGVHTCGAGPFPAVLFHKTAEMALGFDQKRPKYDENGVKMAKIGTGPKGVKKGPQLSK